MDVIVVLVVAVAAALAALAGGVGVWLSVRRELRRAMEGNLEYLARLDEIVYAPVSTTLAAEMSEFSRPCQIRVVPHESHPLLCELQVRMLPRPAEPEG
jgi:hypothetical protein